MKPITKTTTALTGYVSGQARTSPYAAWKPYKDEAFTRTEMISFSHPGPPYKEAGPWYLSKVIDRRTSGAAGSNWIQGSFMLGGRNFTVADRPSDPQLLDDARINGLGAAFFASSNPIPDQADLLVTLGELKRDGLPAVPGSISFDQLMQSWKERTREARRISSSGGSEYLNIEFGWKPLISDMKKLARSIVESDKLLMNYTKRANRWQHRRRALPIASHSAAGAGSFTILPTAPGVFAKGSTVVKVLESIWFEGDFRYYLPVDDSVMSSANRLRRKAKYLLGAQPDPSLVWELSPWSWGADWFGNVGTVLKNISDFGPDGVVARNACLMQHILVEEIDVATVQPNSRGMSGTLQRYYAKEWKTRVLASPFGFNLTWESLSPRQLAIVTALGISRGDIGRAK